MKTDELPARVRHARRWVGAILFIAVFFLPLHFHFTVAAQVSKECSCVHGTRTQTGQVAPLTVNVPVVCQVAIFSIHQESFVSRSVRNQFSRAPPVF